MRETQHTPRDQLGRRFAVCDIHRACIQPHASKNCEICHLLQHKADLLAACEQMLASDGLIGNQPNVLEAVRAMEAAIAKAIGRET